MKLIGQGFQKLEPRQNTQTKNATEHITMLHSWAVIVLPLIVYAYNAINLTSVTPVSRYQIVSQYVIIVY